METRKKWVIALSIALMVFNLVSIYVIIKLLDYDQLLDYIPDGAIRHESPKKFAWLLFVNGLCNIISTASVLMALLIDPDNT